MKLVQFPVGMRVLAVDDDPTCLKVLENLLVRCQYHVTTTNQAIKALKMLRENRDQFDLVISDVHMPDMDGFKLLELVGLELDLPVIMLSANGETQTVMKGITHGACDYLLKPVRIEELRNIWQHVIRRKKFDARELEDSDKDRLASDGAHCLTTNGSSDRNGKLRKKRKDQKEDDDDDCDDDVHDNEDLSTQKKPRVVWSGELHRKFVAAVNQLGIERAVPKRILELMNVERLTRENVASHLQKYRLYLKRLSAVANQQAHMVAALRGRDPPYMPMGSLSGYVNFSSLVEPKAVPQLNSFSGFGLQTPAFSGSPQLGHTLDNAGDSINNVWKLQGNSMLELSHRLLGGFSSSGGSISPQLTESVGVSNQPSVKATPLGSDPFDVCASAHMGSDAMRNDAVANTLNQACSLMSTRSASGDANLLNFRSTSDSDRKWEEPRQNYAQSLGVMCSSSSNPSTFNVNQRSVDRYFDNQTSFAAPLPRQDPKIKDQAFGFVSGGFGLDDLIANAGTKPERDDFPFVDGDMGCNNDLYSLGACI